MSEATVESIWTYFIQSGESGPIKIGLAINVRERAVGLQIANPERLIVLGVIAGNHETKLHRQFKSCHLRGEWFKPVKRLLEFIKQNSISHLPLPPIERPTVEDFIRCNVPILQQPAPPLPTTDSKEAWITRTRKYFWDKNNHDLSPKEMKIADNEAIEAIAVMIGKRAAEIVRSHTPHTPSSQSPA